LFWELTRFSFAVMLKNALRIIVSFTLILSIGYSQLFLAFYGMTLDFGASVQDQPSVVDARSTHFSQKVKTDHSADQQNQDWESQLLEKDPDEYSTGVSLEVQLAFAAVFFCLLSISFGRYHTRFLRYYRNFSHIHSHRLHLYHGVFTI